MSFGAFLGAVFALGPLAIVIFCVLTQKSREREIDPAMKAWLDRNAKADESIEAGKKAWEKLRTEFQAEDAAWERFAEKADEIMNREKKPK